DSTNVITGPAVTGITSLGIDHEGMLGSTIGEIAWHKAGIMKEGVKCFTPVSQPAEAKDVMSKVATEKGCSLEYVEIEPAIASGQTQLGLEAEFQKINASLAVALVRDWFSKTGFPSSQAVEHKIKHGIAKVRWPGRCEVRYEPGVRWCIDGGHTLDSVKL